MQRYRHDHGIAHPHIDSLICKICQLDIFVQEVLLITRCVCVKPFFFKSDLVLCGMDSFSAVRG